MPLTERVAVCTFDPFPATRVDVLARPARDRAHADYMSYLKRRFDSRKHEAGCGHKELRFIAGRAPRRRSVEIVALTQWSPRPYIAWMEYPS